MSLPQYEVEGLVLPTFLIDRRGVVIARSEQRGHRRYHVAFPLTIRFKAQKTQTLETTTQNISANGVYFILSSEQVEEFRIELGSKLKFDIALPRSFCQGQAVQIRCSGEILRVEPLEEEGGFGVAAVIASYKFIRIGRRADARGGREATTGQKIRDPLECVGLGGTKLLRGGTAT